MPLPANWARRSLFTVAPEKYQVTWKGKEKYFEINQILSLKLKVSPFFFLP
jgi:hypothetical protein